VYPWQPAARQHQLCQDGRQALHVVVCQGIGLETNTLELNKSAITVQI